ncbi:ISL3-like element IS1557 family transposase [Nocardioides salsibiostraticola]
MRELSLWRALLGVEKTVIEDIEFDQVAGQIVAHVRPAARARGRCGRCQRRCSGYDPGRGRRRWRALDLGTMTAFLEGDSPRVTCPVHGVVVAHVPWARNDAGHTLAFDQTVAWLATVTSKSAVTELMRIAWRTVGAIIARVWADTGGRVDLFAGLSRIGIDEISYRRGHLFLTVVIDHDTGRLVWAGAGQSKATLQKFFDALGPERCTQISHVSADAAKYIADSVAANCPQAVQVADPFHVVKWANDALGELRLQAWRDARRALRANPRRRGRPAKSEPPHRSADLVKALSRSRYALWKNPENLSPGQQAKLEWIAKTDPRLYRAYQLKEGLRVVFKLPVEQAAIALDRWCRSAAACRIPQFVELQRTVRRQRTPILAAIQHGLSNGRTEAVNTKIRLRTRMAFGFKDPDALIALIMLSLGGHRPHLPGRT